jgi:hypothetical protein
MEWRNTQKDKSTTKTDSRDEAVTKVQFSATGVVVESSVLSIVILTLSLGFFYLYLVYVYPVTNVF